MRIDSANKCAGADQPSPHPQSVLNLDDVQPVQSRTASDRPTLRLSVVSIAQVREAIKLIEADGWREVTTKGSHRQFKHPTKAGRVTIAGQPSDDLAPGTYNSILKQAALKG